MNFSEALTELKSGVVVAREKWNDTDGTLRKWIELRKKKIVIVGGGKMSSWVPKVSEIMAEDWVATAQVEASNIGTIEVKTGEVAEVSA